MDSNQFDALVKSLSSSDTRRELLRRLAPLPLAGLLATLLPDESAAGGRRKRRKTRNTRQSGDDKDNRTGKRTGRGTGERKGQDKNKGKRRKECVPNSLAQTCAGKCATVTNNCGAPVECGSCVCEPLCPECQACAERTGRCVPAFAGDACGDPPTCVGGLATPGGTCDDAGSCQPGTPKQCVECETCETSPGTCELRPEGVACGAAATCINGTATPRGSCNATGSCQPGALQQCDPYKCAAGACATTCNTDTDCVNGFYCDGTQTCVTVLAGGTACGRGTQCSSGNCVNNVCCSSASCAACQACNLPNSLGTCATQPNLAACANGQAAGVCCTGVCTTGNSCGCTGCSQCEACVDGKCNAGAADLAVCSSGTPLSATCCGGVCDCRGDFCLYSPTQKTCCCTSDIQVCCDDATVPGGTRCRNRTCP